MSSVLGIFQNNKTENQNNISRLLRWNRAYGRDNEAVYEAECIQLGCCLEQLSHYALSGSPVIQMDSCHAAIDALLYNREELIDPCRQTDTLSDEALMLSYIRAHGMTGLKDINGDFSGALYDEETESLTLFRDHMGIRPLFYYADTQLVAFSTDIRGLLGLDCVDSSINEDWIYRTVAGYYLDGLTRTEYRNIFCIPPASYVTFSFRNGTMNSETHTYWKLGCKKIHLRSFENYKSRLRELVTDSVQRRLNAIPGLVGAELSGGLDSGVIDILIHQLGRECVYFSWSVDPKELPYAENDERLVIQDICNQEQISCHYSHMQTDFSVNSDFAHEMQSLGFSLNPDEPPALRYALPPYINAMTLATTCECMKRNGAKVVFSGHGGDEGVSHRCTSYEMFYHHEYYRFFRHMWSITHGQKGRIRKTLKKCRTVLGENRRTLTGVFHMPFGAPELLNKDFASQFKEANMPSSHFAYAPIEYIREGGSRNRLDNVALMGAYNGIRYIIPFLDYRVIDFAVSIPRHLYLKGFHNRYLFREAFRDIMPKSLYNLYIKEDNSAKNYPKNPDWYKEFAKRKEEINAKLDRIYWKQYLDFDFIDVWMKKGKPSDEERQHDQNILMCLFYCAMAQNIVDKA